MTKQEVAQRVLKDGKPLALELFSWDDLIKTFSSNEYYLVLDFFGIGNCTFKTGSACTFKTGYGCTFDTGSACTFKTGSACTFKTGYGCTFDTSSGCTFDTSSDCTFKTGSACTFKTGSDCTFDISSGCTFDTGYGCTFKTGPDCVLIKRGKYFEVIQSKENEIIKLCPSNIKGYISSINGSPFYLNRDESLGEYIIADGILSKVINKKGNAYKVVNYGDDEETFIVTNGLEWAHGKTIKNAKESLMYKISDRDTSRYDNLTKESELSKENAIKMYRIITGACESQTREFVESIETKETYTVNEIIEITKGKYNNNILIEFFESKSNS